MKKKRFLFLFFALLPVFISILIINQQEGKVESQKNREDIVTEYLSKYQFETYEVQYIAPYDGLSISKEEVKVTQKDLEKEINDILEAYAKIPQINRKYVKDGDFVKIKLRILDGKDIVVKNNSQLLKVGAGYFDQTVEESLVGKKVGQKYSISYTYFNEEEKCYRKACAQLKVLSIHCFDKPELTDEFVKDNFEYDSVHAFKVGLKKQLLEEKTKQVEQKCIKDMYSEIIKQSKFVLSEKEIAKYAYQKNVAETVEEAKIYNLTLENYVDSCLESSMDEYYDNMYLQAEYEIKKALIVQSIYNRENINCSLQNRSTEDENYKILEEVITEWLLKINQLN
ncbi:MAG: hypothetical protein LUH14_07090 [Clostridiaceae bacterium]|nr:hypothetical protein [Clostridiaceae bacterium]